MKKFVKKHILQWHNWFFALMILGFILDLAIDWPCFFLIQFAFVGSGIVFVLILYRLIRRREITNSLVIAGMSGFVCAFWLFSLVVFGSIFKSHPCDLGPEFFGQTSLFLVISHVPIWFSKKKRPVLIHVGIQIIVFFLINWQYAGL